jgi:hypothetical protein
VNVKLSLDLDMVERSEASALVLRKFAVVASCDVCERCTATACRLPLATGWSPELETGLLYTGLYCSTRSTTEVFELRVT